MDDERKTKKQLIEELHALRHELIEQTRVTQEKFTKAFLQNSFPTVISTAKEGRVVDASNTFFSLVGLKRDEVVGRTSIEIGYLTQEQRASFVNELSKSGCLENFEMEIKAKSGALKYGLFNIVMLSINNEIYLLTTIQDITEIKNAAANKEKLEAQNRQIQKTESLSRMAGAVAHHFNNQLAVVMGNLEMAMKGLPQDAEPVNGYLNEAIQAAEKAAQMSSLMLTYLGHSIVNRDLLDLSETCRRSLPIIQSIMPGNVELEIELPSFGPTINADAHQIQQILNNLIINAWEAVGENVNTIHLKVKVVSRTEIPTAHRFPIDWQPLENNYACLEVIDTGCGIEDKNVHQLFDPFYSTKFTGRGLGLPVVEGIVKTHNGAVIVESKPGKGSSFRVFLPVSGEEVIRHRHPNKAVRVSKFKEGGIVLLVEDEDKVRDMAAAQLKHLGFAVLKAKDGVEALAVFRRKQDEIHFVLSDLTMPRMNGWETLLAVRKLAPDIPVILASGYDESQVMSGEHTELPQAFLGKPYTLKGLSDAISQALG